MEALAQEAQAEQLAKPVPDSLGNPEAPEVNKLDPPEPTEQPEVTPEAQVQAAQQVRVPRAKQAQVALAAQAVQLVQLVRVVSVEQVELVVQAEEVRAPTIKVAMLLIIVISQIIHALQQLPREHANPDL
jgi:hypothetical protein